MNKAHQVVQHCTGLEKSLQVNADDLSVSAAACVSRHPSVSNYLTVELTVLKEMAQSLADLFGLRLPVPCEKQAH